MPASIDSIHHSGSSRYVSILAPHLGDVVRIRLRHHPDLPVEQVLLRTCPDGEQHITPMQPESREGEGASRWWSTSLMVSMPLTPYRFIILGREMEYWYNSSGLHAYNPTDAEDFRLLAEYATPAWVKHSVFYQIFPDRFADGDPSSNVRQGEYEYNGFPTTSRRWGEPPSSGSRADMVEFYGGDLPGITAHLDYIADLGANALYLNPVFTANSNHRYDVTDYFSVDPHLGGNQALVDLRQALAERGMQYILDIVPNHCGLLHPWFQAALADPQAPTAEYFTIRKRPDDYESWLGVRSLPKFNYRSAALRQVMYAGQDSVFKHWLQLPYAADGWRIDVANMLARQGPDQLGMEVGRGIRKAVKQQNPQAYLMGENVFDASSQLLGDCWDGVMNYSGFWFPLLGWLLGNFCFVTGQEQSPIMHARTSTEVLVNGWTAFRAAIPWVIANQQFNLIGSHDTPRALAILGGNRNLLRLAVAVLLTYPGVPSIYYGDEIGLGADLDRNSRQCMNWDPATWDHELLAWYKTLIHLRRTSPALAEGGFQVLLVEPDTLVYQRDTQEETIVVAAHRGGEPRPAGLLPVVAGGVPDGAEFEELFSGERVRVTHGSLLLPAMQQGAQIWVGRTSRP